jgi:hypothetical protein
VTESCFYCGERVDEDERHVLMLGRIEQPHCSEACLKRSIRNERKRRAALRRRWSAAGLAVAVVLVGAGVVWRRFHAPRPEWISMAAPEPEQEAPPTITGPIYYGPAWPPTDEDWAFAFARGHWVYPLPGPMRRATTPDEHIFVTETGSKSPKAVKAPPPQCREKGRCGADLGGELWGEHVYAARDGIIDRVQTHGEQGAPGEEEGGGQYVRIAHYGGMAFTQYFHLAGTPRQIVRGARVRAGDVIGLLGDTGVKDGKRHLTFALSTRPPGGFPEVYWDPAPLMATWSLHSPPHGTVAGLLPAPRRDDDLGRRRRHP